MNLTIKQFLFFSITLMTLCFFYLISNPSKVNTHKNSYTRQDEPSVYLISTDKEYPPFSEKKEHKTKGIDIELLKAIAKKESILYQLTFINFADIIPMLVGKKTDAAIAAMTITEKRKQILDFSLPYYQTESVLVTRKDTIIESIDSIDPNKLKQAIFGVNRGTVAANIVEEIKKKYSIKVLYFKNLETILDKLIKNEIFAIIEDYPAISYLLNKNKTNKKYKDIRINKMNYPKSGYSLAVPKNKNKKLIEKFNRGLKKIMKDGTYQRILNKYFK